MHPHQQNKPQDILCDCSGTTKTKIRQLIQQGSDTLDKISRATGACSGCGACDYELMQFLTAEQTRLSQPPQDAS